MARLIHNGTHSADAQTALFGLSNVGNNTVYVKVTDGGGSGTNYLTIDYEGCPNPTDSDASKEYITDSTEWNTIVLDSSADLPYENIFKYTISGIGRFNLDYDGGGTKSFTVKIWVNP